MITRPRVDPAPSTLDVLPVIGHFNINGGGLEATESQRAPSIASGLFGKETFEFVGRRLHRLNGATD